MKKLMFIITMLTASMLNAQTIDFHTNVTNLWYQGYKSNVLEIAEQRLNVNSNDIAGLILKLEFSLAVLDLSSYSNISQRVIDVGTTITSTNFAQIFPFYTNGIHILLDFIPSYTPVQIAEDMPKTQKPYKSLPAERYIKALQDDGYFEEETTQ